MADITWPKGYAREHFLADLITKHQLQVVAELGIWKGRTFIHLLAHCPWLKVIGVDAWAYRPGNAKVPGGETYAKWDMAGLENHVRTCSKAFGERAVIMKMETADAAKQIEDGSLDLVFIDADHSEGGVARDIASWAQKVRSGGFITGHDIDWPTVKKVVQQHYPNHQTGPDNVWWVKKP